MDDPEPWGLMLDIEDGPHYAQTQEEKALGTGFKRNPQNASAVPGEGGCSTTQRPAQHPSHLWLCSLLGPCPLSPHSGRGRSRETQAEQVLQARVGWEWGGWNVTRECPNGPPEKVLSQQTPGEESAPPAVEESENPRQRDHPCKALRQC